MALQLIVMRIHIFSVILIVLITSGCVSSRKHDAALQELADTKQSLAGAESEIDMKRKELAQMKLQLDSAGKELVDLQIKRQDLQQELQESRLQIEMLREVEYETQRRNEIYAQFVERLQSMIDAGQLSVNIRNGRIVIELPNNVLFDSGRAELNQEGREALTQVANILIQFQDRRFQVEGHTDNNPISSAVYPSNWELSTARALAVVHLLIDANVDPTHLSAAGFGEYQPKVENETPEGRQLNRRIEIVMLPNLDILSNEIPKLEQ
ncbi:MAG: OmpA family protein [Gammaproteobacteria bacterium]|nr:OmpA family protein [Gammaproteobacteria bacterium]